MMNEKPRKRKASADNNKEILCGFDDQDEDLVVVFGTLNIKEFCPKWKTCIQWFFVEEDVILTGENIPTNQAIIQVPGTELQGCEADPVVEPETVFVEKRKKVENVKLSETTQEIRQKPVTVETKPSFSYNDRSNPYDLKENEDFNSQAYRDYSDTHDTRDDRFQKRSTVEKSNIRKKGKYPDFRDYLYKPSKYSKNCVDKDSN
jgi:hypothetical protein